MKKLDNHTTPLVTPLSAALKSSCPHCGEGKLYKGILTPASECNVCELDYSFIDSGDGPAVFVILILGFFIMGLALMVENVFQPPIWLHAIIWIPLVTLASVWALRFTKALMIALQYKTKAAQAKLKKVG